MRKRMIWFAAALLTLLLFLSLTNPEKLALPLLLIPFGLVFLVIYWPVLVIMEQLSGRPSSQSKKIRLLAMVVAGLPLLLLLLQSLHQLSWRDVVIVLILGVGLIAYLKRLSFDH